MLDNQKPGIEEIYTIAGNTSDLTVEADRGGAGDVLIAAGWSASRMGAALLRLHSEWDAAEKPRKLTQEAIARYALTLAGKPAEKIAKARKTASEWHMHELRMLMGKLKTLPAIRGELAGQAHRWEMEDCQEKAGEVLKYWLDQNCATCEGRKWRLIPGTPGLSNRTCHACQGSGIGNVPCGQDGRRMANYLEDCVSRARQSIKKRLHPSVMRVLWP